MITLREFGRFGLAEFAVSEHVFLRGQGPA
jgi:hypothetical protein